MMEKSANAAIKKYFNFIKRDFIIIGYNKGRAKGKKKNNTHLSVRLER